MDMVLEPNAIINLQEAGEDELAKLKLWLFHENMRVRSEQQELKDERETFEREVRQVKQKISSENKMLEHRESRCALEEKLIADKWQALKRGFDELDEDRRALKRMEKNIMDERRRLEADLRALGNSEMGRLSQVTVFFRGVNDSLSLKKRYRDLLKIFHPDNVAGDKETVISITEEYDQLKESLE